jgi:hypothetical protein
MENEKNIESLPNEEYKFIKSYELSEGKTLDDIEKIATSTSDGKLEFRICYKGNIMGKWNQTTAESPKEQVDALIELINIFGEDKIKS